MYSIIYDRFDMSFFQDLPFVTDHYLINLKNIKLFPKCVLISFCSFLSVTTVQEHRRF